MTRIKYTKKAEVLRSQSFLCGTVIASITIFPSTLKYAISTDKKTLKTGTANTLTSLKKKAKLAAKELGASFLDEVRNSGKTERFKI